jgi:ribonuclease HI
MQWWSDGGLHRICVTNDDGKVWIEKVDGTSNENEFRAMILALTKAVDGDIIFADSQLVVNELIKNWKCRKAHLMPLYCQAKKILSGKKIEIEWVSRNFNRAGWILEG